MTFDHVALPKGSEALHKNTLFINPDNDPTTRNTHVAMNAILCALEDQADRLKKNRGTGEGFGTPSVWSKG